MGYTQELGEHHEQRASDENHDSERKGGEREAFYASSIPTRMLTVTFPTVNYY